MTEDELAAIEALVAALPPLIVSAPTAIPRLLREVRAARELLDDWVRHQPSDNRPSRYSYAELIKLSKQEQPR